MASGAVHADNLSTPSPARNSLNRRIDRATRNEWAPNAWSWREPSTRAAFVQVALFLFSAAALATFLIVNFWAGAKLETSNVVLEPHLHAREVIPNYSSRNDLIDYAALENGAAVLPKESSPSYHGAILVGDMQESLAGFNKLDYLISSSNTAGHCWAFEGTQGFATIHLARAVLPSQFSLIHPNVLPTQSIHSQNAPKDFSVYSVGVQECWYLGSYVFDFELREEMRGVAQYFPCRYK